MPVPPAAICKRISGGSQQFARENSAESISKALGIRIPFYIEKPCRLNQIAILHVFYTQNA